MGHFRGVPTLIQTHPSWAKIPIKNIPLTASCKKNLFKIPYKVYASKQNRIMSAK